MFISNIRKATTAGHRELRPFPAAVEVNEALKANANNSYRILLLMTYMCPCKRQRRYKLCYCTL